MENGIKQFIAAISMGRYLRLLACLLMVVLPLALTAQKKHLIPLHQSKILHLPDGAPDMSDLVEAVIDGIKWYQEYQCREKMNPIIEANIKKEMRAVKVDEPYTLGLDKDACKFLFLSKGHGPSYVPPNAHIYEIRIYPDITREKNFPGNVRFENIHPKTALVASYRDDKGKWFAGGPLQWTAIGFDTEDQALAQVHLPDLTRQYIQQLGKYRIYALNADLNLSDVDIRVKLKEDTKTKRYTILIPDRQIFPMPTAPPDFSSLLGAVYHGIKQHRDYSCRETLNPIIEENIRKEMRNVRVDEPYSLGLDLDACKFIFLAKGHGPLLTPPNTSVFLIRVYPDITTDDNFPGNGSFEGVSEKTALVASYQDEKGMWFAGGPLLWTSVGYKTEEQALSEVHLPDFTRKYIQQLGKYRIYILNTELNSWDVDIRNKLTELKSVK